MYFLLKSIEAIIIINANTKKFSNSKLSFIMTKRMQVKTIAKNGVIFFIQKYTKNYLRMCVWNILAPYPASFLIKVENLRLNLRIYCWSKPHDLCYRKVVRQLSSHLSSLILIVFEYIWSIIVIKKGYRSSLSFPCVIVKLSHNFLKSGWQDLNLRPPAPK